MMTKKKWKRLKPFNAKIMYEKKMGKEAGPSAPALDSVWNHIRLCSGSTSLKGALLGINCACIAASPLLLPPPASAANYTLNAAAFCWGACVLPSSSVSGHLSAAFPSLLRGDFLLYFIFCNPLDARTTSAALIKLNEVPQQTAVGAGC